MFRGDTVKDESGFYAAFTEQGASASQMAAAKFLDAIARMPGMKGEASDAVSAYTQVFMAESTRLLKLPADQCPETWISLPRERRPASWGNVQDPVALLECNLLRAPSCRPTMGTKDGRNLVLRRLGKSQRLGMPISA